MQLSDKVYAVVGASNNPRKYGYKVLRDLRDAGWKVVPVNPKETEILGLKAYSRLIDIKAAIDTVIFVVPPAATKKILKDVKALNIKKVWLQPGAASKAEIKYCRDNNIECVHDACIMVQRRK